MWRNPFNRLDNLFGNSLVSSCSYEIRCERNFREYFRELQSFVSNFRENYISIQVTCYSAVDGNNWFKLETPTSEEGASQVIRHNDVVRLKHSLTGKYLTLFDGVESVSNELANLVSNGDQ